VKAANCWQAGTKLKAAQRAGSSREGAGVSSMGGEAWGGAGNVVGEGLLNSDAGQERSTAILWLMSNSVLFVESVVL